MGNASSATISPDSSQRQCRQQQAAVPRRKSLFSSADVSPTLSASLMTSAPPMTEDVVQFLLKAFDEIFCIGKGFSSSLQTSLLLDVVDFASFPEGSILMTQGEIGQELFIIENGDVEVLVNGETVCHFRRGAIVGELAMLYDSPRSATIRCLTLTTCYILSRRNFKAIQEIASTNAIAKRTEWLQGVPEFSALGNVGLYKIVQALESEELKKGDVVYQVGIPASRLYIIESGSAEMRTKSSAEEAMHVGKHFSVHTVSTKADAEAKEMVDELLPKLKASAKFSRKYCSFHDSSAPTSVKAFETPVSSEKMDVDQQTPTNLVSNEDFAVSVWAPAEAVRRENSKIMSRVPSFCGDSTLYSSGSIIGLSILSAYSRHKLFPSRPPATDSGEWVWTGGDDIRAKGAEHVHAGAIPPFDVIVTTDVATVLSISLEVLDQLFRPFSNLWMELQDCVKDGRQFVLRKISDDMNGANSSDTALKRFNFSKFDQLCFIKDSAFGCSSLVRYYDEENKSLNSVYYLIRKSKFVIAEHNQIQKNLQELNILKQLNSPFVTGIVGLSISLQEISFVFKNQGIADLWSYIYEYTGASQADKLPQIKCILASIVMGLDHIHSLGISFRELKPEFISIDDIGRVRLSDFSSAKKIPSTKLLPNGKLKIQTKSFTLMGTPEYLAPEMVLNSGIDHTADVWALGIIAYEMLMLSTPFADAEGTQVFSKIASVVKKGFRSPAEFSRKAGNSGLQQFVEKILRAQPSQRLSCAERKTVNILRHSFFKDFDVAKLTTDHYSLPGYSDLTHHNATNASPSYKMYSPEVLPYTGDPNVWKVFDDYC